MKAFISKRAAHPALQLHDALIKQAKRAATAPVPIIANGAASA